jgi:hypothetical protein
LTLCHMSCNPFHMPCIPIILCIRGRWNKGTSIVTMHQKIALSKHISPILYSTWAPTIGFVFSPTKVSKLEGPHLLCARSCSFSSPPGLVTQLINQWLGARSHTLQGLSLQFLKRSNGTPILFWMWRHPIGWFPGVCGIS